MKNFINCTIRGEEVTESPPQKIINKYPTQLEQTYWIYLLMSRNSVCVLNEKYVLDQWEAFSHDRIISFNVLLQSSKDFDILAKLLHLQGLTVQWSWSTLLTSSSATSSSCRRLVTVCAHNRHFVTDLPSQASLIPLGTGNLLKALLLGPWSYSWTLLLITIFLR